MRPCPTVLASSPAPVEERGSEMSKKRKITPPALLGVHAPHSASGKLHQALAAGFSLAKPVLHRSSLKKSIWPTMSTAFGGGTHDIYTHFASFHQLLILEFYNKYCKKIVVYIYTLYCVLSFLYIFLRMTRVCNNSRDRSRGLHLQNGGKEHTELYTCATMPQGVWAKRGNSEWRGVGDYAIAAQLVISRN